MPGDLKQRIQNDLPNFPEEVVEGWVMEHVGGWEITNPQDLGPKFLFKSLDFWRGTTWELVDFATDDFSFSDNPENPIYAIAGGFLYDVEDPKTIFDEITEPRYINILSHILNTGTFPVPVCLLSENGNYSITDGSHRVYALRVAGAVTRVLGERGGQYFEEFKRLLRERWNIESLATPSDIQKVWIATAN